MYACMHASRHGSGVLTLSYSFMFLCSVDEDSIFKSKNGLESKCISDTDTIFTS